MKLTRNKANAVLITLICVSFGTNSLAQARVNNNSQVLASDSDAQSVQALGQPLQPLSEADDTREQNRSNSNVLTQTTTQQTSEISEKQNAAAGERNQSPETSSARVKFRDLTPSQHPKWLVAKESPETSQQPPQHADAAELAKKLANPVASLISFPIQTNFDFRMGTGSGWRMTTNIQPVIPIALNKEWNLISRTIVPVIHQGNVTGPNQSQTGLGDTVQSLFISPNKTEPFIWGVGPAILVPTATNSAFQSKQLGLGPTVVVLKQQKGWTVGALWNHIWRVAGGSGRPKVNSDFIQPFLSYSTKDGWSYSINTESTYDWTSKAWGVPIHFTVTKVVRLGKQPVSFGGAVRCWATSPTGGPEGCGIRMIVTGIFPKK